MKGFRQQLVQKQQLNLSPMQIQQAKLLELTGLEVENRISREIEENPALEESPPSETAETETADDAPDTTDGAAAATSDELIRGDYSSEDDIPDYRLNELYSHHREQKEEIPYSEGESFQEYLLDQLRLKTLTQKQMQIGEYLIGSIDDDGYIRRDEAAIADDLAFRFNIDATTDEIHSTIEAVRELDPAGVGACCLRDCLLLQLRRSAPSPLRDRAITILERHFDEFTSKQYARIAAAMQISADEMKAAVHEITRLNPRPGNSIANNIEARRLHITPDFFVDNVGGELVLSMHENLPSLCVSSDYDAMLDRYSHSNLPETEKREAVNFVRQKIDSARWFIDAIRQRTITLRTTMEAIIRLQREFFLSGNEADLRPMILKDVADACGYDISTISRVSNSKFVQTTFGVYPLKFFFSESMRNSSGEEISTREVKQALKTLVRNEDKTCPLTDDDLLAALQQKGYKLARRTVAKYREQLNIPVARLRKGI
jgi:RNA polymerase sigma-54 factor